MSLVVACHLAPAITDAILDENRECCNNELEQTLMLLHSEWSKEIEPSRQNSTHHPFVASNPIQKKVSEFERRNVRFKAPSIPTAAYGPRLLSEQDSLLVIGKTWFLDKDFPASGFVRIQHSSQVLEGPHDESSRWKV